MNPYIELTPTQVGLAAILILLNASISIWLRLGLTWSLLIAAVRCVIQLILIGFVLEWLFRVQNPWIILGLAGIMTLIAGRTAVSRNAKKFRGIFLISIGSVWISSWIVTGYALLFIFSETDRWYDPQYAIPLLGMVLGNTLNGISVGLSTFTESIVQRRDEVESALALGATRFEAARGVIQNAITTGMLPIINSMMIVGLVSLPGMMTGQLVSGVTPIEAAKYQIVIMFLIASATALGTCAVVLASYLRLFSTSHQFLAERLPH